MERAAEYAAAKGGQLVKYNGTRKSIWKCREGHQFLLTEYKVKRRGKWCSTCGASNGEREIRRLLSQYNIPFIQQAVMSNLPGRKFDFYFQYQGRAYLLEYDGEQHFEYVRKYHKTKQGFHEAQLIDKQKTYAGVQAGCYVIRIDYTQKDLIHHHIYAALQLNYQIYLSTPSMYPFLY